MGSKNKGQKETKKPKKDAKKVSSLTQMGDQPVEVASVPKRRRPAGEEES